MTYKQIENCTGRLAEINPADAEQFALLMELAANMSSRVGEVRREAWAIYHRHFVRGRMKEPQI